MTVFDLADSRADARERHQSPRPRPTAAQSFHAAVSLHQHGRLREAEQLYRAVLNVNESDFDCLHNLGLLHAQEGRFDDGKWTVVRQLGGDDIGQGEILTLRPNTILRVVVYRYE